MSRARRGECYLTGGATGVLRGWQASTLGVDIKLDPEHDELLRAPSRQGHTWDQRRARLAGDFIPLPEGWRDRSASAAQEGRLSFLHFDLYSWALAKLERGHAQDVDDVRAMLSRNPIERERLGGFFSEIGPWLYRFPAIDVANFYLAAESSRALCMFAANRLWTFADYNGSSRRLHRRHSKRRKEASAPGSRDGSRAPAWA